MADSCKCKMCGGVWVMMGAVVGAGIGFAMDNVGMGAGIGVAVGVALMLMMKMCKKDSCSTEK